MISHRTLRTGGGAAQRPRTHAAPPVAPPVLVDPVAHTAYVRRFEREWRAAAWRSIAAPRALAALVRAHVVLLGEYHPLPSAARTAMDLLSRWRAAGSPCALALEMVYARDQRVVDEYLAGALGEAELRRRLRYREEWGYSWAGPGPLLRLARRLRVPVLGLDIPPRGGAEDLALRDAVAAARLAHLLEGATTGFRVAVVFGEAHVATGALPARLAARLPRRRIARVFHDLSLEDAAGAKRSAWLRADPLTFARRLQPAGARPRALELTWRRWAADLPGPGETDLAHLVHGLIAAQAEVLGLDPRRRATGPSMWLADDLPEVFGPGEDRLVDRILRRRGRPAAERTALLDRALDAGAAFDREANIIVFSAPGFDAAALAAGSWLASALRGPAAPLVAAALEDSLAAALALTVDPALEVASSAGGLSPQCVALGRRIARSLMTGRLKPARLLRWLTTPLATDADVRRLGRQIERV